MSWDSVVVNLLLLGELLSRQSRELNTLDSSMPVTSNRALPPPKPECWQRSVCETILTVEQVVVAHQLPIWDIRPFEERLAEPGFIPSSRSVPLCRETVLDLPWDDVLSESGGIVLCCLSGKRSGALVSMLQVAGYSGVVSLYGGLLAWAAEGYELCVPSPAEPEEHKEIIRVEQLFRAVMSCFIAESAQSRIDGDAGLDASEIVASIFGRPGALGSYERTLDTLDLLGENARRMGHPIDRIASNLDAMRATALRLIWT